MEYSQTLTAESLKKAALDFGADLVAIGSIDRWDNAPADSDPKTIMPRAKSVVCIGLRLHRGLHRGVEEGTYFSAYSLAGFIDLNHYVAPIMQRRVASFIEDYGYEATPVMYLYNHLAPATGEPALYKDGTPKPAPDVFFNFRIAGQLCGAGEVGLSRLFLSEKFGPSVRLYFIITDAPLEADPIITGICDHCGDCIKTCPTKALLPGKKDDVDIPGVTNIRRCGIDFTKCALAHSRGAVSVFAPPEVKEYARNIADGTETETADGKPRPTEDEISEAIGVGADAHVPYTANAYERYRDLPALCGECIRSCLAHLEKTDRLTLKFHNKFRE